MSSPSIVSPEDFSVEELPLYEPTGSGEHTFVWVEKRLCGSEDVARWLARAAGVPPRAVGYAGRKDRFAVARQCFSVPGLSPDAALALERPGVRVLRAVAHRHKLRTGQLRANRFDLRVRGVDAAARERARERSVSISGSGLVNRFGPQRFGRARAGLPEPSNVERGLAVLTGREPARDRRARFWVSALQAAVFNHVLEARPLPLDRVERGDLARRSDSGGVFLVEDEGVENERAARFEISATGPIFGTRTPRPAGAVALREAAALAAFGLPEELPGVSDSAPAGSPRAPRGLRLRGARRPLRVEVADLSLAEEDDGLRVRCTLPAGTYATVLLEELLGQPVSIGPAGADPSPGETGGEGPPLG